MSKTKRILSDNVNLTLAQRTTTKNKADKTWLTIVTPEGKVIRHTTLWQAHAHKSAKAHAEYLSLDATQPLRYVAL